MEKWFGESWGAPCCEPEAHAPTPVGELCARCREPILVDHQGLIYPLVTLEGGVSAIAYHLDCKLLTYEHPPSCPRCRGMQRHEHEPDCAYRSGRGEFCDCLPPLCGPADTPPSED